VLLWFLYTSVVAKKVPKNSFPNAKRRLCTKHLKDNVIKHYLQNRVGVNTTERNNIMSAIFGDDGLVSADNTFHNSVH
jgi:hypothetical protein